MAALGFVASYVAWFLSQPGRVAEGTAPAPRSSILWQLLLPDEVLLEWLGQPREFAVLDRLPLLGCAAAILLVSGLAGSWLVGRLLRGVELPALDRGVLSLGVGLNVTSLYALAVGLAGGLQSRAAFLAPAAVVCAAAIFTYVRRWRAGRSQGPAAGDAPPPEAPADPAANPPRTRIWTWLAAAAPLVAAILLGGMLPPWDFDVREYHLQAPKEFYQLGRVQFLPHNVYANMNLGAEFLALPAMAVLGDWWRGALVGKLLIALFAPLGMLGVYCTGRRFLSPQAGGLGALVYIATPWVADVSMVGMNDAVVGCYVILTVYAIGLWRERPLDAQPPVGDAGRLLLVGWLAGAAVAVKYPALLFVLIPALAAVGWLAAGRRLRAGLLCAAAALAACGPWFVKNAVLAGNPTYPLLASVLGGRTRTPEKIEQFAAAHRPRGFAPGVPAYSPRDFLRRAADVSGQSLWHSPVIWPLAMLALVAGPLRRRIWPLAGYLAFVFLAWWACTHRIDRFWLPALPVAALAAGAGATALTGVWWRRGIGGVVGFALLYGFLADVGNTDVGADHRYFASLARLRTDPQRVDPAHLHVNAEALPGEAVLLVGDAEAFDLEVPTFYNTVFDDCWFEHLARDRSPAEVQAELARRNIGWIYVKWVEIDRYRQPGNYGFTDFVQTAVFSRLAESHVLSPPIQGEWQGDGAVHRVLPAGVAGQRRRRQGVGQGEPGRSADGLQQIRGSGAPSDSSRGARLRSALRTTTPAASR